MLRKRGQKGFTLIELLIVIAIIGILAAIAIPMYRAQTIKARLSEVTNSMSTLASALGAYRQENEAWPSAAINTFGGIQTSLGVSVPQNRISGIEVNTEGRILCTVTNIDSTINGCNLTLSATIGNDGAIQWVWGTTNNMPPGYIPKR
jgi:type IV pilus assembly protein PilA